jgi:hypothetical protein
LVTYDYSQLNRKIEAVKYLIITLFSLVLVNQSPSFAASDPVQMDIFDMSHFSKEIDFALDYTSITIQQGHILGRKMGERNLDELEDAKMEAYLREVFENYIELYERRLEIEKSHLKLFKDAYKALNYKVLWADFKNTYKNMKLGLKKRGAGFWIAMMCGIVNEAIFDLIAWTINPWLLSITLSIPYNVLWVSGSTIVAKMNMKKRLTRVLGSKEKYNEYMEYRKGMAESFQRKNFDRYIIPLKSQNGEISTVVINKRTVWEKILWKMDSETKLGWKSLIRKAGLKDGAVNYFNVTSFLDKNSIENAYLTSVRKSPLNKKAKVALILNHVFSTMDQDIQFKFKDKFSSSFITLEQSTSWKGMRQWTKNMLILDNWDDVKKGLNQIPEWVDAREIEGIWRNILLPLYSESIGIGYFKYRRIIAKLDEMRALFFISDDTTWNFEVSSRFFKHAQKALTEDKNPACYNGHQKVLNFLVNKISVP